MPGSCFLWCRPGPAFSPWWRPGPHRGPSQGLSFLHTYIHLFVKNYFFFVLNYYFCFILYFMYVCMLPSSGFWSGWVAAAFLEGRFFTRAAVFLRVTMPRAYFCRTFCTKHFVSHLQMYVCMCMYGYTYHYSFLGANKFRSVSPK